MGCASAREKLESKIMLLKLKKVNIIQERENKLREYQKITGKKLERNPIPDYIIKNNTEHNEENIYNDSKRNRRKNKRGSENLNEDSNEREEDENQSSNSSNENEYSDESEDNRRNRKRRYL